MDAAIDAPMDAIADDKDAPRAVMPEASVLIIMFAVWDIAAPMVVMPTEIADDS